MRIRGHLTPRSVWPACGVLAIAILLAAGCASTPKVRYYTLDMTPAGQAAPAVNIAIERLRESETLARRDLLVHKTATEIEYYANARWASAVNDMLAAKFQGTFGEKKAGRPSVLAWGTVLDCGQVDAPSGTQAVLKVQLAFRMDGTSRYEQPLLEKVYEEVRPAKAANPAAVVVALSECAEAIAAEIARDAAQAAESKKR